MIYNTKEILFYQINTVKKTGKYVKSFSTFFFNNNEITNFSDYLLIMDNAKFHYNNKFLELLSSKFHRVIFIAVYCPSNNLIEFQFEVIKRKIKKFYYESLLKYEKKN